MRVMSERHSMELGRLGWDFGLRLWGLGNIGYTSI